MVWRPGRVWLPAMGFTGLSVGAINEGGAGNFVYGEKWEGSHTGAPITVEIAAAGVNAVTMDTAGDMVATYMQLPYDFDIKQSMYVRVHWSTASVTTADTIDWIVTFLAITPNTTAIADATTALNSTIAQDTVPTTTADTWNVTAFGRINGDTFTEANEGVVWKVEMDAFAAGLTEAKNFLGLELVYTPKRLVGVDGMRHEAKRGTNMFSKDLPN